MSDFYDALIQYKEENSLTYKELGALIGVDADTFRMGVKRKSFKEVRINRLKAIINNEHSSLITNLSLTKDNVTVTIDEMLAHFIIHIKKIEEAGKLDALVNAVNTVKNINDYNVLHEEIIKIKGLIARNKDILK